jgi:hypothetical protein
MNFIFKAFCIKIHGNCINKSVKAGKLSVLALSCFLADMLIVNTLFSFNFLPTTATLLIWYQLVTQLFPFLFEFTVLYIFHWNWWQWLSHTYKLIFQDLEISDHS